MMLYMITPKIYFKFNFDVVNNINDRKAIIGKTWAENQAAKN